MPNWVPYFALSTFPLVVLLCSNWIGFSWGFHHGGAPMPHLLLVRVQKIDQALSLVRGTILLTIVLALAIHENLAMSEVGWNLSRWQWNTILGTASGILLVVLQVIGSKHIRLSNRSLSRESWGSFLLMSFLEVSAEEVWIAVCLVTLRQTGHSSGAALALTALVFGIIHYHYRFGGAVAKVVYGTVCGVLFLKTGSLLAPFLFHYIGNIGVFRLERKSHPDILNRTPPLG